jgi:hypothetical protein
MLDSRSASISVGLPWSAVPVLLTAAGLLLPALARAQTVIWSDTFEDSGAPSSGTRAAENDAGNTPLPSTSYFKRTDNAGILLNFGAYTAFQGAKFWAGEDHDTQLGVGNEEQQIDWTGINIAGQSGIEFRGLFAANSASAPWDSAFYTPPLSTTDYIRVDYRVDGGAYQSLLYFVGNDATLKQLRLDTNGDNLGDGTLLTPAFGEIVASLPNGNTLDLRLRVFANGSSEEWAVDNFRVVTSGSDTTPPTVTGVTSPTPNGTYDVNGLLDIRVDFSEIVNVVGTPTLTLETGATDRVLSLTSGSGTPSLTFSYRVQAGENSGDLDYVGTTALSASGGTIRDSSNNTAVLTLAAPGAAGSLAANKNLVINTASVALWSDTFEDTGAPSSGTRTPENNSGVGGPPFTSYFVRTDNAGVNTAFGGYTGGQGTKFWAGEDHDGVFGTGNEEQQIDWGGINIAGQTGLQFRGWFAANIAGGPWDDTIFGQLPPNDYVIVEGSVDGGAYQTLLSFRVNSSTLKQLALDTNLDGIGDASPLTPAFTSFSAALPTGNTLALRLRASCNANPEEWAVDNFRIVTPDGTPPTVTGVTSSTPNGPYNAGDVISIQMAFSETVLVTGNPTLTLETGAVDRTATYQSGSGSTSLTFTYTVSAGDTSADLDYTSANALALAGGTIRDLATNNATLTLPAPAGAGSLGNNKNLVIDTTAPNVTGATANGSYRTAGFSQSIAATDTNGISTYGASGLPTGLSVASGTGLISGTPTQAGSFGVTISATDPAGNTGSATLNLTIAQAALTISGVTASGKVYDGTTTATLGTGSAALVGVISPDSLTLGGTATGAFADRHVGVGKPITVSGFAATGAASANYTLAQPTGLTATITAKALSTVGLTATSRTYDATTVAALTGVAAPPTAQAPGTGTTADGNPYSGDTLSIGGTASAAFADRHVGVGKAVTVTGLTLGGAQAGNYALVQPTGLTATISAKALTASGLTAAGKVYDTTTSVTLSGAAVLQTPEAPGIGTTADGKAYTGDTVSLNGTASGAFASKAVGVAKPVTVSGLSLSGAQATNYTLTPPTPTADITPAGLAVAGVTANSRAYNATTVATLVTGGATLVGVLGGDTVILTTGGATGAFADKNVGIAKPVTVAGLATTGADAGNYALSQPTTSATITTAGLTVSGITASNKVYDTTTVATLATGSAALAGIFGGDAVTLNVAGASGVFADETVGNGKTVTVSGLTHAGTDGGNYTLAQPTTTANVTAAGLTVTGITASNKVYDATTAATLATGSAALVGVLSGDTVTLNVAGASGTFANKTVGNGKTVTAAGLATGGGDAGNYTLTQPTTTADITPAGLTVTGVTANDKAYDSTTAATLATGSAALSGVLGSDAVTLGVVGSTGVFADPNVGNGKPVTVSGMTTSGADAGNYTLTQPAASASITAAGLTVTGITAASKVYDATTPATVNVAGAILGGVLGSDVVTLSTGGASGAFATKVVGVNKPVTVSGLTIAGAQATNYLLTAPTPTADITAAGLTVSGVTALDKPYDGTTSATLVTTPAALVGILASDLVTLNTGGAAGTFATPAVGIGKPVTVSGLATAGADAGNYTLAQPTTTASITAAGLTVTGITAASRIYDATTAATLSTVGAALSGVRPGDTVTLAAGAAVGTFVDKNIGVAKVVTIAGVTTGGPDAANYTLTPPTTSADITAASLSVSGITASDKVYDATTLATLGTGSAALVGVLGGDVVGLSAVGAVGTFVDKNVGTGKVVNVAGLTKTGADAGNYLLTQPTATASITQAGLTVSGVTASDKVYDTTTAATISTAGAALVGVLGSDVVTLGTAGASGTFADENVGIAKPVGLAGLTAAGADAGNYTLSQPTTTADITPAGLTVTGVTAADKVYDATTAATLTTGGATLAGVLAGDVVTLNTGAATGTFADKNVGVGKAVTVAGLATAGVDAGNYGVTQPTTTASITPAGLTVSGVTAADKAYDGNTTATLQTASAALVGRFAGDAVTLNTGGAVGAFADPNIGVAKPVSITGLATGGLDAPNYTLTQPSATASITRYGLTVAGITALDKVYDGTTAATLQLAGASLVGVIAPDVVTLATGGAAGTFDTPTVGVGKPVAISGLALGGAGAGNYTLTPPSTTASITQATATVTLDSLVQAYDGTPRSATATTVPPGLAVSFTYGGSPLAPTASGTYAVVGTVADVNYQGSATGTLIVIAAVTSLTAPTNGNYRAGDPLDFTVHWSGDVTVTGTPAIDLVIGTTPHVAIYQSGSGTSDLHFRYVVQATDRDLDGITVISPVALYGGTITDGSSQPAARSFAVPNTGGVLVYGASVVEVPTLGGWGAGLLVLMMMALALRRLAGVRRCDPEVDGRV